MMQANGGWYYRDYLIRCKDAFKDSVQAHKQIQSKLNDAQLGLDEANKIAALLLTVYVPSYQKLKVTAHETKIRKSKRAKSCH